MAKVKLIGLQDLDFTNRQGEQVQGLKLFINFPDENVMGIMADSKFINRQACINLGISIDGLAPLIGKDVDLETNIKGHVVGVKPIEQRS